MATSLSTTPCGAQTVDELCCAERPGASQARHPTLRDVAALAEVDPSVVSRVLRNDPRLTISPQTRQRVLAASERLNYQPNIQARGFRLRRTWTMGSFFRILATRSMRRSSREPRRAPKIPATRSRSVAHSTDRVSI